MAGRLRNKVAFVMGAGSVGPGWGNGKATAMLFAREGADVFAVDIDGVAARETVSLIRGEGGSAAAGQADATNSTDVAKAVQMCVARFGRIDILQNNVGGSIPGGPVELSEAAWDGAIAFNLKSAFLTCKHAIPVILDHGGGVIVNVSSVAGIRALGDRAMASYQAAKAGLIQFTRGVALQYARQGLRANCVLPGLMNTPLVTARIATQYGDGDAAAMVAARDAQCPTGKMGDAWDVAHASLFLASDEARYVTATELIVDGGLSASCG